jgi:hypothetical protein
MVGVSRPARVLLRIDPQSMVDLLTYPLFFAEQTLRSEQQDSDKNYQCTDVLEVGRDKQRAGLNQQTDH